MRKFWSWMVGMVAQQHESTWCRWAVRLDMVKMVSFVLCVLYHNERPGRKMPTMLRLGTLDEPSQQSANIPPSPAHARECPPCPPPPPATSAEATSAPASCCGCFLTAPRPRVSPSAFPHFLLQSVLPRGLSPFSWRLLLATSFVFVAQICFCLSENIFILPSFWRILSVSVSL